MVDIGPVIAFMPFPIEEAPGMIPPSVVASPPTLSAMPSNAPAADPTTSTPM